MNYESIEEELAESYSREEKQDKENERLHSIIKEVREYIEEKVWDYDDGVKKWTEEGLVPNDDFRKELLEILDKENE